MLRLHSNFIFLGFNLHFKKIYWKEAPGKTQDTLGRLYLQANLGTPWIPLEELEELAGER